MTPVRFPGVGYACCGAGCDGWQPAVRTSRTTSARWRTRLDVGPSLTTIDCDTRAGDEARLPRAQERDHARDFVRRSEPAERHLAVSEVGDAVRVGLLAAVPAAALPQDRARGDRVDGHALGCDLTREGFRE